MEVHVLGALEVIVDGHGVPLGGPKERALLALLVVHRGPCPQERLIADLWGDDPPPGARKTLQTYVWRLRNLLPPDAITSTAGGYQLQTSDEADIVRFEHLIGVAASALKVGEAQRASELYREALELWRGEPFGGCALVDPLEARRTWLDELHSRAVEGHLDAQLRLGHHSDLIGELEHLVRTAPLRERLWEMLALALYRSGRQAEALRACRRARDRLVDELGLEPGVTLTDLERSILTHDPSLQGDAAATDPSTRARVDRGEHPKPGNLPMSVTSFVGQAAELQQLVARWPAAQLITLIGPGGVGKTRFAQEAARLGSERFADGVWFCPLAPLRQGDAVAHSVAAALLVRPQDRLTVTDSIVDAVQGRQLLLILDNCEHVLDAVADLVTRLATSCPTVSILTTSREPIDIAAERVWPVRPLLPEAEGTELFYERASAAGVGFTDTPTEASIIATICERLDGLPLAIELAAARMRSMTVADVAERLDDRFRLLRAERRGEVTRHLTLEAALQWSYELLTLDERIVFDHLAVFAGGFDVAAVERVCTGTTVDLTDVLASLVDKSMVIVDRTRARTRFSLLESLRHFAVTRLQDRGDFDGARARHLWHYVSVAEEGQGRYEGSSHLAGAASLQCEWDNFRSAMTCAEERHDAPAARRLLRALFFFSWFDVRHELGQWAEQVIARDIDDPVNHGVAGFFAVQRGDREAGLRLAEKGATLDDGSGGADEWICSFAAAFAHWYAGRVDEGWYADKRTNEIIDYGTNPFAFVITTCITTSHACYVEPGAAPGYLEQARRAAGPLQNPAIDAMVEWVSGMVARTEGRALAAFEYLDHSLTMAQAIDNRLLAGLARLSIAISATVTDAPYAQEALKESLSDLYAIRDWHVWLIVEATAIHWARVGQLEAAAVLLGHLEQRDVRHGAFADKRSTALHELRALPEAQSWLARGANLNRDEVVAYALQHFVSTVGTRVTGDGGD